MNREGGAPGYVASVVLIDRADALFWGERF
jgi:hypothetical protein